MLARLGDAQTGAEIPCISSINSYTEACSSTEIGGIMDANQRPTKQEVRDWLRQTIESRQPPAAPDVIAGQLWNHAERERKAALS